MKRARHLAFIILALFTAGCATTARDNQIPFTVRSDPSGCPVEVNGIDMGCTPTTINLGFSKRWVGLAYASDGWEYGNETYQVTCFPPPDATEQFVSQTKTIRPSTTPKGADLYFNMRLRPYVPPQPVDIKRSSTEDITIKHVEDDSAKARLQALESLHQDGLISDDEYQAKRKQIIDAL